MTCPKCESEFIYHDGVCYICTQCSFEWTTNNEESKANTQQNNDVKDSNGNILTSGDSIILIKDLPLKGSSIVLKKGSKAKNIRLSEGDHQIDCKIDGMKVMLKSCFVKKA